MKSFQCLALGALLCAAPMASAETASGQLQYHNHVIFEVVTVDNMRGLNVWTDSNSYGGFDPILAVWNSNGTLIGVSDDNPIHPWVGAFDASLLIPALEPGVYTIGLSMYGNFPTGPLADGYWYDSAVPVALPNAACDAVCASYRMHWTTDGTLPIPEPSTYWMLLAGLGVIGARWRRRVGR